MRNRIMVLALLPLLTYADQMTDDKAAFSKVCGSCHAVGMVDGIRTEADWRETVNNMIMNGAKGTPEQFDGVIRYLLHNQTKVNVNTASAVEIAPVLDVSDVIAEAIVRYRTANGAFRTLTDLGKVPGLNQKALEGRGSRIVF